jgi:16S rRNA processing protein RimM
MIVEAVTLGKIVKAVGLKGEVKLNPSSDFWLEALETAELDLVSPDGIHRAVHIENVRSKGATFILRMSGINDIDGAESVVGHDLAVTLSGVREDKMPREALPCQLVGLKVRLIDGSVTGEIVDLLLGPNQNCLIVEDGSERFLVPNVPAVVKEVDLGAGYIVIDPPEGLRDLKW